VAEVMSKVEADELRLGAAVASTLTSSTERTALKNLQARCLFVMGAQRMRQHSSSVHAFGQFVATSSHSQESIMALFERALALSPVSSPDAAASLRSGDVDTKEQVRNSAVKFHCCDERTRIQAVTAFKHWLHTVLNCRFCARWQH
jgi:hypothetical protein